MLTCQAGHKHAFVVLVARCRGLSERTCLMHHDLYVVHVPTGNDGAAANGGSTGSLRSGTKVKMPESRGPAYWIVFAARVGSPVSADRQVVLGERLCCQKNGL